MNKRDLVVAARKGFPDAERMVNNMLLAINTAFLNKEKVIIDNFGQFKPHKSKVKKVYNFKEKHMEDFKGEYTIKFKPCPEIRKRMNKESS